MKKIILLSLVLFASCGKHEDNRFKRIGNSSIYLHKTEVTYNNDTDTAEVLIVFSGIGGVSVTRLR